ncbi:MAG: hypothetical protein HQL44_11035 [Alphaproteobacteria bacterium]|nr:hypothetical protein [Alphaproteobacteria bacterium]
MSSVFRLLAGSFVVLGLSLAPISSQAQTKPTAAPPAKASEKNVLQPPAAKPPTAAPQRASPPQATPAPRAAVETRVIPAFVPPGPPPMAETDFRKPVLAVLKAAQAMNPEEDAARWVDAGPCWVWIGMKRDQAWAKYRFAYEGACRQGRADGKGRLKVENQDIQGKWVPLFDYETNFIGGVPLGDAIESGSAKLAVGLPNRSVLSWMGASLNEESEVFTVGKADDQGRVVPCAAQGIMAAALATDIGGERFKSLLRRSVSVVASQCPDRLRNLWLATLVPSEGLVLSSRQGLAGAEPVLAQAEIREGLIYTYSQRFASPPALAPQGTPVPGAQPLAWTPPIEELDHQLLLVVALPVFLLLLLLVAMRIAYASTRQVIGPAPAPAVKTKPANNAKRR